jgi:ribosomal protein L18E
MKNLTYFIDKFSKIPKSKWTVGTITAGDGSYCALGHMGVKDDGFGNYRYSAEAKELARLIRKYDPTVTSIKDALDKIPDVNDGGRNPKIRMVNYLKKLREKANAEAKKVNKTLVEKPKKLSVNEAFVNIMKGAKLDR